MAHDVRDTLAHFRRCLVGEGERHDAKGIDIIFDEVGDAIGEYPRFSGARTGNDHHRTVDGGDGIELGFV